MEEVTLRYPASGLLSFNPVGRVPSPHLDGGTVLNETLLILPYLDRLHQRSRIMPTVPPWLAELAPSAYWMALRYGTVNCAARPRSARPASSRRKQHAPNGRRMRWNAMSPTGAMAASWMRR